MEMEVDWLFWFVAFVFFLPMHAGAPALFLLVSAGADALRAKVFLLISIALLSAMLGFGIAMLAWPHSKLLAGAVIAFTLTFPWLEILWQRYRR